MNATTPPIADPRILGAEAIRQRVLELTPRCSLTAKGARYFVAAVATPTFGVAGLFTLQGFWPVLPFAGLEIALLWWAVRASLRSGQVRETITISEEWVTISRRDRHGEGSSVFPRHWTRVTLHAPLAALHPSRLVLESHGRACEVGKFLTEDERRSLAVRLKQLVGNVNESPAL
jgi:uncharacterized membrane protein